MNIAMNAALPRNANAVAAPKSHDIKPKLPGLSVAPPCATVRDVPKNIPRASLGATSVPNVCMLPEITLIDICTATKAAMNHEKDVSRYAVAARNIIDAEDRNSPGTMVYLRPKRSITYPTVNTMGIPSAPIAPRSRPSSSGAMSYVNAA